jgi:hypothetical protein
MARRNPGEILFTTAGPNIRPNRAKKRTNGARMDVLREMAHKAGYHVETYSPGDGTTRYRFFDLTEMARKGVSAQEQSYFGPLNGVHTALGLAAAKKFLSGGVKKRTNASVKRTNGAKSVADPVAARELELYIENEYALVGAANSIGQSVMKNLAAKMLRGTYDATKAWKGWMFLVDEGAKRYNREFGTQSGVGVFNKATREMVAVRLAEVFEAEVKAGAIDPAALVGKANPRKRK